MKTTMKNYCGKFFALLALTVFTGTTALAQPGFDGNVNDEETGEAPISNHLAVLAAAGAIAGYIVLAKRRPQV